MQRLLSGYRHFREETWPAQRERFAQLAESGQKPHTMVIACSDSRVDPAVIFAAAPGEMFIVRNVANLVPPYAPDAAYHGTSAALEFGVRVLGVSRLVVMGHAQCGGVTALLDGAPPEAGDFVAGWMEIAAPARRKALACDDPVLRQEVCELETVRLSLANLHSFPWVQEALAAGRLKMIGAHFGVATGRLLLLESEAGEFVAA